MSAPYNPILLIELATAFVFVPTSGIHGALADSIEVKCNTTVYHLLSARLLGVVRPAAANDLRCRNGSCAVGHLRDRRLRSRHRLAVAAGELALSATISASTALAGIAFWLRVPAPLREEIAVAERAVQCALEIQSSVADLEEFVVVWAVHPPRSMSIWVAHVGALVRGIGERVPAVLPLVALRMSVANRPRLHA